MTSYLRDRTRKTVARVGLLALLATSVAGRAGLIEPGESSDPASLFGHEREAPGSGPDQGAAATVADPEAALAKLERLLAERGDIDAILRTVPALRDTAADARRVAGLYAVALAASGRLEAAETQLQRAGSGDTEASAAIRRIARSIIARHRGDLEAAKRHARTAVETAPDNAYAHNQLGMAAAAGGEFDPAEKHFAKATRLAPRGAVYWSNLGSARLMSGDEQAARQAFDKALGVVEGHCPALLGRAEIALRGGRRMEAEADLRRCLEAAPAHSAAARRLLRTLIDRHALDQADSVLERYGNALEAQHLIGAELALHRGMPDAALDALGKAPDSPQKRLLSVYAHAMRGEESKALDTAVELGRAGEAYPDAPMAAAAFTVVVGRTLEESRLQPLANEGVQSSLAHFYRALDHAARGETTRLIEHLRASEGLVPGFRMDGMPDASLAMLSGSEGIRPLASGVIYYLAGFREPASDSLAQALEHDARLWLAGYFRGLALASTGERAQAVQSLERALTQAPAFHPAHLLAAELLVQMGRAREAIPHYRAAADTYAQTGTLAKLGLLAQQHGQLEVAEQAYRDLIELEPELFVGYNQLAWLYAERGVELDRARELAEQALRLRPGNVSVLDTLGWIHFQQGRPGPALEHLRAANEAAGGNHPEVLLHLAHAEAEHGDRERARELLRTLVSRHGQQGIAQRAERLAAELGMEIDNEAAN